MPDIEFKDLGKDLYGDDVTYITWNNVEILNTTWIFEFKLKFIDIVFDEVVPQVIRSLYQDDGAYSH